jgi:hypothetical protein
VSPYEGRRSFRTSRAQLAATIAAELLFVSGAVYTFRTGGVSATSAVLALLALAGLAGVLDGLVRRIELTDDALLVHDLLRRRRIPREEIAGVEEARGVPTMLVLRSGPALKLPDVGHAIGTSIRAWLRAGPVRDR